MDYKILKKDVDQNTNYITGQELQSNIILYLYNNDIILDSYKEPNIFSLTNDKIVNKYPYYVSKIVIPNGFLVLLKINNDNINLYINFKMNVFAFINSPTIFTEDLYELNTVFLCYKENINANSIAINNNIIITDMIYYRKVNILSLDFHERLKIMNKIKECSYINYDHNLDLYYNVYFLDYIINSKNNSYINNIYTTNIIDNILLSHHNYLYKKSKVFNKLYNDRINVKEIHTKEINNILYTPYNNKGKYYI